MSKNEIESLDTYFGAREHIGFHIDMTHPDKSATCSLDLQPCHMNRVGLLHGGIAATLLDSACGLAAARQVENDATAVTVSLNVSFISAAKTGTVIARGRVLHFPPNGLKPPTLVGNNILLAP